MSRTITLPNGRACSDFTFRVRLKDDGTAISWDGLSDIKAHVFSDVQKALAGRCEVSVDQQDHTILVCEYSATKPQYLGVNSIVIRATYQDRVKTYDKPAVNIVPRTANLADEEVVLEDPVVDVEIEVTDVDSSILDGAIAAALDAAEKANSAASHPPVIIEGRWWIWNAATGEYVDSGTTAVGVDGLNGASPYIGPNGNWFAFNDATREFYDTGIRAQGPQGLPGQDGRDGGLLYPTFEVDAAMHLRMSDDDAAATCRFSLKEGHLTVTV